jgi:glycosyltransferase involved in cell wall biosynthesis
MRQIWLVSEVGGSFVKVAWYKRGWPAIAAAESASIATPWCPRVIFKPANDVTAVVLSTGEPTTQEAIDSLHRQTIPVRDVIVVRDVAPFHKALNVGAAQVETPFFVQVDADMILDPHSVAALRWSMRRRVGIVVGHLRDALIEQVVGVKLFRTACFKATSFQDTISPDTDFVDDMARAGWKTIYIGRLRRGGPNPWATLGEHRPDYSPAYTYRKHLLEGRRYRYRQKVEGLRWHFGRLEASRHPAALIAQIALARGLFLAENRDLLGAAANNDDFARIEDFLSSKEDGPTRSGISLPPDLPLRERFRVFFRLGNELFMAHDLPTFRQCMDALNNAARDDAALASKIALCRGLGARNTDMLDEAIEVAYRTFRSFLARQDVLAHFIEHAEEAEDDRDQTGKPPSDLDLESIAAYAANLGLARFVVDGSRATEYQTDRSAEPPVCRSTGRAVTSAIDTHGRPRIKAPFGPLGHIVCTQPERATSIFWCFDLLISGYAFAHLPTLFGPRKVSLAGQFAKNCLARVGIRSGPASLRSTLRTMARDRSPSYKPIARRVLMITSTFARGGSELQMVTTAAALIKRGYDVGIVALWPLQSDVPSVENEIAQLGIKPRFWSDFAAPGTGGLWSSSAGVLPMDGSELPPWFVDKARSIQMAICQHRPTVVHGWLDVPAIVSAFASCGLGVPRVVVGQRSVHQNVKTHGGETSDLLWEGYRAIAGNPTVTILNNSAAGAADYEKWLLLRAGTMKVLHNCLPPERVRVPGTQEVAEFRARFGLPREAPVVGTIMRFVPDKDPGLWLETAAKIALARPDVRFLFAGYGNLQEMITSRIDTLGIGDRCVLPGAITDVGLVYGALDVVLLTSAVEGLPNVLIEAQAAGRPVVATDVGGSREAVLDGRTGTIVRERSPSLLAKAVLAILDDPDWRTRVQVDGPNFAAERFGVDRITGDLLEIYGLPPQAPE